VPVQNGEIDYFSGRVLKEIYEFALLELGGQELLDDATNKARSHVDAEHPWSGLGGWCEADGSGTRSRERRGHGGS
jgi:hypothetical protein